MARELTLPAPGRMGRFFSARRLAGVVLLATAIVVFYPMAIMVVRGLLPDGRPDVELWRTTLADPALHVAARNTLVLALATTLCSVPIGLFFAWLVERTDAHWGTFSRLLPVIPLLLPPVGMAIGWLFLADPRAGFIARPLLDAAGAAGLDLDPANFSIQSWAGMVFLYVLWGVPHVYVVAAAAYANLDPSLEEAARMCGKGRLRCFWQVSLPSIRYAVGAAALLCMISSVGMYSIAALIGSAARIDVLSVYVYRLLNFSYPPKTGQAVVIGLLLMLLIGALWLAQRAVASRGGSAQIGGMGVRPTRLALGRWRWPARAGLGLYVALTSLLPLAALVIVAMQPFWRPAVHLADMGLANFQDLAEDGVARAAIRNSILLALATSTLVVFVAALIAIVGKALGRGAEKSLAILAKVPAAIPHIVFAVGVLIAFGFAPFGLAGGWSILLLAYLAVFLPSASLATESSIQQVGPQLVEASRVFGATAGRTFRTVQLPLILPGLAAGWATIFALVLGELNAAAILSGPHNPVIGYLILSLFDNGTYSQLAAVGALIGVVSAIALSFVLVSGRPRYAGAP